MLHGNLGGVFYLVQVLAVELCQGGGGHGAGGADLCLAAAFGAGDGGIALGQVANDAGGGETPANGLVGVALSVLDVFQDGGENAAGPTGGGGDNGAVVCVLLGDGIGIGGDFLKLLQGGSVAAAGLIIEVAGLSLHVEPARQGAGGAQAVLDGLLHGLPYGQQEVPDVRALVELHIVAQRCDIAPLAEVGNLSEGVLDIDLLAVVCRPAGDADVTAADGLHPQAADFLAILQGDEVQGVWVGIRQVLIGEEDLGGQGSQCFPQDPVCAVANAGFAQRSVEDHPEGICLGILPPEELRCPLWAHGMGGRGTFTDLINFSNGFHCVTSNVYWDYYTRKSVKKQCRRPKKRLDRCGIIN